MRMEESKMRILKSIFILLNVATIMIFLYSENRLTWFCGANAVLLYLLSCAIHLIAHESGHFLGGVISGYKLVCLRFGPISIICKNNRFILKWKFSLTGQCIMTPQHINPVRFKAYNSGGIWANALIAIFSFTLLLFNSFWTSLLFIEMVSIGISKILVNAIPHKTNEIPNDGYTLKLLKTSIAVQKDYATYLRLYGKLFFNEEISAKDYIYKREVSQNTDEMLYYNEIQDILSSLE